MKHQLFGQNFHDAYDAIVGAGKDKKEKEMVNVHDHNECQHEEMKYCKTCDLTYCKKCLREWGTCRQTHYFTYVQPTTIWPYISPYITTTGSITLGSQTISASSGALTGNVTVSDQCNHS